MAGGRATNPPGGSEAPGRPGWMGRVGGVGNVPQQLCPDVTQEGPMRGLAGTAALGHTFFDARLHAGSGDGVWPPHYLLLRVSDHYETSLCNEGCDNKAGARGENQCGIQCSIEGPSNNVLLRSPACIRTSVLLLLLIGRLVT